MTFKIDSIRRIVLNKFFISAIDIIGAIIIAMAVSHTLPMPRQGNYVLEVWLIILTLMCSAIDDNKQRLMLDSIFAYIRVLKIAAMSMLGYILFFVVTRHYYSLTFLLFSSSLWLVFAIIIRRILHLFTSPIRGLTLEPLPHYLANNKRVLWETLTSLKGIDLNNINFLLVDFHKSYEADVNHLIRQAHNKGIQLVSATQLTEYINYTLPTNNTNDQWIQSTFYANSYYLSFKRVLDVIFTLLLLPILLPLLGIISLLVLLAMGRPVFFAQQRMGRNNIPFKILKFRTMSANAEACGAKFADFADNRVTKLGKILRRMRLDELPQFYNVLVGQMSIIGPRPEQTVFAENFTNTIPLYELRHWVRPGITGWSQIMYGYAAGQDQTEEKLSYDMFYLKNLSLWLDLTILLKTAWIILTGFGSR